MRTYELVMVGPVQGIKCLRCGSVSHNRHDIENRFCGKCHEFHKDREEEKSSTFASDPTTISPDPFGALNMLEPDPPADPGPADPPDFSGGGGNFGGGGASGDF